MDIQTAHVEITHLQNQLASQISIVRSTLPTPLDSPIWMEDMTYSPVHPSDDFTFVLVDS